MNICNLWLEAKLGQNRKKKQEVKYIDRLTI